MKFFLFALLLLSLLVVQISVLPHFSIMGVVPNLLFLVSIFFIFYVSDYWELITFSFMAGFFVDVYSGIPFGIILVSFILAIALVYFLAYNFFGRASFLTVSIGLAVGLALYSLSYFILFRLYEVLKFSSADFAGINYIPYLKSVALSIILNIIFLFILYQPLKKFVSALDKYKK